MARCEAEYCAARPGPGVFLACDLDKSDHAGLNHHDGIYGIWWNACTLLDHGHAGTATETRTERRRQWRASLRGGSDAPDPRDADFIGGYQPGNMGDGD